MIFVVCYFSVILFDSIMKFKPHMKFIFFTLSPFLLVFLMLTGADTLYAQNKSAANKKQDNTIA